MSALSSNKSEAPQKTSFDEDTDSKSREIAWRIFFRDFHMCLFRLKFPVFLIKVSHPPDFEKLMLTGLTNILVNA